MKKATLILTVSLLIITLFCGYKNFITTEQLPDEDILTAAAKVPEPENGNGFSEATSDTQFTDPPAAVNFADIDITDIKEYNGCSENDMEETITIEKVAMNSENSEERKVKDTRNLVLEKYGTYENFELHVLAEVNKIAVANGNPPMERNTILDYMANTVAEINAAGPNHIIGHIKADEYPQVYGMCRGHESIMLSGYITKDFAGYIAKEMTTYHTRGIVEMPNKYIGIKCIPVENEHYDYHTDTYYIQHAVLVVINACDEYEYNNFVIGDGVFGFTKKNGFTMNMQSVFRGGELPTAAITQTE